MEAERQGTVLWSWLSLLIQLIAVECLLGQRDAVGSPYPQGSYSLVKRLNHLLFKSGHF